MIAVKTAFPMHEGAGAGAGRAGAGDSSGEARVQCVVVCGVENVWCARCEKWVAVGRGECPCEPVEVGDGSGELISDGALRDVGCMCATGVCEHT